MISDDVSTSLIHENDYNNPDKKKKYLFSGETKIVIDSKLATALFEAYSGATKTIIDSKLATALFQAYSGVTDLFIKTKLDRLAFEAYSGETDTFIKTKLDTDVFTGFTASTKNVDKKIQVVSISTANANTVAVTKIDWDSAPANTHSLRRLMRLKQPLLC